MAEQFPFQVEYAKSGRASCKGCKENISKDTLRMAIMVQSPFFDGKMPMWHHYHCFFKKKTTLKSTSDIANFDNLRWEDQEKIRNNIGGGKSNSSTASCSVNNDFSVEYAKSNKSACRGCGEKIIKAEIRISKLDTESATKYGPTPLWHHVDCFVTEKNNLGYFDSADRLPGYAALTMEDKAILLEKIGVQGIKRKAETESPLPTKITKPSKTKEDKIFKVQNELLFQMRDDIKKSMNKRDMVRLLEHNNQHISTGESRMVDHLSDCLVFGALKECPDCKNERPRFLNNTYVCNGNLTEWTKCQYTTRYPERENFIVPDEFREDYEFLKKYKCEKKERKLPKIDEGSTTSEKNLPLSNMKILFIGKFKTPSSQLQKKASEMGATTSKTATGHIDLCISTPGSVIAIGKEMTKVQEKAIHVVSVDFLDDVRKGTPIAHAIKTHLICTWGEDPILKFGIKQEHPKRKYEAEEEKTKSKSVLQKITMTIKGAVAVDPESGLEHMCHVYQKKDCIYNSVLAEVDMMAGRNSFYKLQILEADRSSSYHLFRSWGRVGTSIGGKLTERFNSAEEAIAKFEELYLQKTLNNWWDRNDFKKKPGGMYPLDIDYGQENELLQQELKPGDNSKLAKPVQELICLLFDIEAMKKAMVEFEIDLKKMPLGKLSKKQMEMAYKVLCDAQQVLVTGMNSAKITDVSNRFYTLIPHDFGMKKPPLLDHDEIIKAKIEMVDSLMEIEFAYSLLKGEHNAAKDPVDEHYEKLKTDIDVIGKDTEEYKRINTYLKNTHAHTHNQYNLELKEVFKIKREGEDERYKQFKDLHNKKLLWHGSRLTNFVGILSQGLRIAPPEAPASGYMFGKGVYFADMVSKSANYCWTSRQNATGMLLLCEVALGNMYEKLYSEYIKKLPKGKHSTYGMGMTLPDYSKAIFVDGVEIPCGKPVTRDNTQGSLLYNEYIVYDVNQINIKYLLKVNFKWKH